MELLDQVLNSNGSRLRLMRTSKAGDVKLRQGASKAEGTWKPITSPMERDDALGFIGRFVVPLLNHRTGRKWLGAVITGRHMTGVLWALRKERFGLTGTVSPNPKDAGNRAKGAAALIFIDEHGPDWMNVPDLRSMPDIGFLHELYHAHMIQQGLNDGMTEREARIEENRYRNERGASSLRELP